jgi:hypothetical protein
MSLRAVGSTGNVATIRIFDVSTGLPKPGLTLNTSGATVSYKPSGGTAVSISLVGGLTPNWKDVSDGSYEVAVPDAAYTSVNPRLTIEGTLAGHVIIPDVQQVGAPAVNVTAVGGTAVTGPNDLKANVSGLAQESTVNAVGVALVDVSNRIPDALVSGRIKADATLVADQAVNVTKVGGTSVSGPNDLKADVTQIQTDVGTLLTRIPATLFAGITSLAKWFGLLAGKTADAGALAELQATTAGASFSNTTDSLEAIRDRGDAAWVGGLGSGDYQLTLTISDGTNGVSGARVSLVGTGLGATTGTSGIIRFNVSGLTTYSVRVAPPSNFQSPADTSVVVGTANVSQTITLTANAPINPSAAPKCNVALPVTDGAGTALTGAKVSIEFIRFEPGATPSSLIVPPVPELTSTSGLVTVDLLRLGRYRATYSYGTGVKSFEFVVPDSGSTIIVESV